jgi:hypothetical protein
VQYSEEFDDSYWIQTNLTVTPNVALAPNGVFNADEVKEDTTNGTHILGVNLPFNYLSGQTYTVSCYIKANNRSKIELNWRSNWFPDDAGVQFDLIAGTRTLGAGADDGTIESVGNNWYRVSATATADATGSSASDLYIYLADDSGSLSYAGDGTSGVYLWGAQLEANSYATSYIPTSGSTATRAADVSTSAATFGNSWYEQSEGTVYHLYNPFGVGSSRFYSFNDGTANNQILGAASNGSGSASNYIEITAASVNQGFLGASEAYSPTLQTGALAYIVNNCAYSKNGGAVLVDTSVTIPTVNTLNLGSAHSNSAILNGTIRRLTYWPTRLSNDTLQTITV